MFLAMLRFDFVSAFFYNPLMFTLFFFWNIVAILCFWGRTSVVKKPQFLYTSLGVSVALFTIFAFLRNIY